MLVLAKVGHWLQTLCVQFQTWGSYVGLPPALCEVVQREVGYPIRLFLRRLFLDPHPIADPFFRHTHNLSHISAVCPGTSANDHRMPLPASEQVDIPAHSNGGRADGRSLHLQAYRRDS